MDFGQEEVIEFTAPTEEGAYPYLCSFPGHHRLMRGMLYVTNDLQDFLKRNPQNEMRITEWKHADFEKDLTRVGQHRNFEAGKQLFSTLGCAQCHRMSKADSAAQGQALGPNVDDSVKKYKQDASALLREILEPSRNIDDKYRQLVIALEDGTTQTGVVAEENEETLTLLSGSPPKQVSIPKSSIDDQVASNVSIMPTALLNTLDREQILDLLAYLLSGGDAKAPAFHHNH